MSSEFDKPGNMEILKGWWEEHRPRRSELEKAEYEIRDYKPLSLETSGQPSLTKIKVIYFLAAAFLAYWTWRLLQAIRGVSPMDPTLNSLAVLVASMMCAVSVALFWKLNEGCFSDYLLILEPFLVITPDGIRRSIFRMIEAKQVYPFSDEVIQAADLLGDLTTPKDGAEIPTPTPATPTTPAEESDESEEMPSMIGSRPSSIEEMLGLFKSVMGDTPRRFKEESEISTELEEEFVKIVRETKLPFYGTVAKCPDSYAMFLSERPLVDVGIGTQPGVKRFVEFRQHSWHQKTYVWQKLNNKASFAGVLLVDEFRYYLVDDSGKERLFFAPVYFVIMSDGLIDEIVSSMKRTQAVKIPEFRSSELVKQAYVANLAEKLFSKIKNKDGIISNQADEIKTLNRRSSKGAKRIVAEGLRWMVLATTSLDESLGNRIYRLLGGSITKAIITLIIVIFAILGAIVIVQMLTGITIVPIPPNNPNTPTQPQPYEPGSFVLSWILAFLGWWI